MRPPEKDSKEVRLRFRHESKVEISSITVMLSRYYREPPFPQWPDVKTRASPPCPVISMGFVGLMSGLGPL